MLLGHNLDIIFMILPGADGWCGSYSGGRRMEEPPDDALVLTHALESLVRSRARAHVLFLIFKNLDTYTHALSYLFSFLSVSQSLESIHSHNLFAKTTAFVSHSFCFRSWKERREEEKKIACLYLFSLTLLRLSGKQCLQGGPKRIKITFNPFKTIEFFVDVKTFTCDVSVFDCFIKRKVFFIESIIFY